MPYLDDGFGIVINISECKKASRFVRDSLEQAGFLINKEKSVFEPSQSLEWLELIWDSRTFSLTVPERKINETFSCLVKSLNLFPNLTARELA